MGGTFDPIHHGHLVAASEVQAYFDLDKVQDAHARSRCRDQNGTEPWSCGDCDCSARLEARLATRGRPFLASLKSRT